MNVFLEPCRDPAAFQEQLDALDPGAEIDLRAFEYPGPVAFRKDLVLRGHGATIWAVRGPVCSIASGSVHLSEISLEVTDEENRAREDEKALALTVEAGAVVTLDRVQVRGAVSGLSSEEGNWRYPSALVLPDLPYGRERHFLLRIEVPVPCRMRSRIQGIEVEPGELQPGTNELTIRAHGLPRESLVSGLLVLETKLLKRQVSLTGRVVESTPGVEARDVEPAVLYEAGKRGGGSPPKSPVSPAPDARREPRTASSASPRAERQAHEVQRESDRNTCPTRSMEPAPRLADSRPDTGGIFGGDAKETPGDASRRRTAEVQMAGVFGQTGNSAGKPVKATASEAMEARQSTPPGTRSGPVAPPSTGSQHTPSPEKGGAVRAESQHVPLSRRVAGTSDPVRGSSLPVRGVFDEQAKDNDTNAAPPAPGEGRPESSEKRSKKPPKRQHGIPKLFDK